jgi:CubicO group peptidase (beta-lactamase class C family)
MESVRYRAVALLPALVLALAGCSQPDMAEGTGRGDEVSNPQPRGRTASAQLAGTVPASQSVADAVTTPPSATRAQLPTDNPLVSDLDKAVHAAVATFFGDPVHVGLSIAVSDHGRMSVYNYGTVSKANPQLPTPDSLYEVGSVTKAFTGAIAAKAMVDGKVTLDGDFRLYLSEPYPNLEKNGKPITLRTLISHTSGLPRDIPANEHLFKDPDFERLPYQLLAQEGPYDRSRYLSELHDAMLGDEPGKTVLYSNIGIKLISFGLENVYGQSFADLLKAKITDPLNMPSTALAVAPVFSDRLVQGYTPGGNPAPYHLLNAGAAGGLYSSTRDMARYVDWHLDESDPAVALTHATTMGSLSTFAEGLGWNMALTADGERKIWQSGGVYGMSSQVLLFPDRRIGVVLLANDGGFNTQSQLEAIALAVHQSRRPK